MRIRQKKLVGIPVRTASGQAVGRLADIELDTDTGRLEAIVVRTSGLIPGLIHHEVQVAWPQIISLCETEAVVADGTVPIGAAAIALGTET